LDFSIPTSMQVDYDLFEKVKRITFLPTSEVRW
ncbi:MAG: pyocin immunity protein, partial [Enterobacteriaceae bacterium]|nr:pyocin immunity protein [Enterobacteriaceae bacterium]